ncbi:MAG TPA: hypothetical protein VG370_24140 [Chloroflexota bacterium]|jgi:hypothetical protein|nr:hypothetical protein [Chloroflexota bacterium]
MSVAGLVCNHAVHGRYNVEENVIVTAAGREVLTDAQRELFET